MPALVAFDPAWGGRHDEAAQVLLAGSAVPAPSRVLLAAFIQHVQERYRVAVPTIEAYTLDLTMLARWAFGQHKGLGDLGADDLVRYLDQRQKQGIRPATLARHLSSYRRFYSFLVDQGVVSVCPVVRVEGMRVSRRALQLLSDPAIALLMHIKPDAGAFVPLSAMRRRSDITRVATRPDCEIRLSATPDSMCGNELSGLDWSTVGQLSGQLSGQL